jgi:hypothetical protein
VENNNGGKYSGYFSKKLKAGKRRTYFFDVRSTKQGDFFLTITESKKKFDSDGYESHKIFLYKEDFKKFLEALNETVDYIKTDLMPDYDYESERPARPANNQAEDGVEAERPVSSSNNGQQNHTPETNASSATPVVGDDEEMDWN